MQDLLLEDGRIFLILSFQVSVLLIVQKFLHLLVNLLHELLFFFVVQIQEGQDRHRRPEESLEALSPLQLDRSSHKALQVTLLHEEAFVLEDEAQNFVVLGFQNQGQDNIGKEQFLGIVVRNSHF